MGTSKGYISPSTPKWATAKRGISSFVSYPTDTNKKDVAAKYAKAIREDSSIYERASSVFSSFSAFISSSNHNGVSQALNDIGKGDINDLPPEEAFTELINTFSEGSTIDDIVANNCIADALIVLGIESFDDFPKIDYNDFIKELVCQFAKQKFAQMFDKHINSKCENIVIARTRQNELQEYIYYTIKYQLTDEIVAEINPRHLANEQVIKDVLDKAFDILEHYYDE